MFKLNNMKIHYITPYSLDKNIGQAYNDAMCKVKQDDFVCFVDGDARFTTHNWGHQIAAVLKDNPQVEYATCLTNRVNCLWQLVPNVWEEVNCDIHRAIGFKQWNMHKTKVTDMTNINVNDPDKGLMSGVMILVKRRLWEELNGFKSGLLGVDNDFHLKARKSGHKLWLMEGIYMEHWYRGGDCRNKSHLL